MAHDLVLKSGLIVTPSGPINGAVAIAGERIVGVGGRGGRNGPDAHDERAAGDHGGTADSRWDVHGEASLMDGTARSRAAGLMWPRC